VFDASGQVHAVLQHTTDVTDVQRTRAELEAVRQAQGATPEQLWQGVVSRARAVQDANSALEAQRTHLMSLVRAGARLHGGDLRPEYIFEIANPAYEELVGRRDPHRPPAARRAARDHRAELPAVARPGARERRRRFVGRGMEVKLASSGGELHPRFVDFVFQPIIGDDGQAAAIFVQGHDVTDREVALDALRESEQRFRTIAEMIPQDGVVDAARRFTTTITTASGTPTPACGRLDRRRRLERHVPPDDQARAWARWRHSSQRASPTRSNIACATAAANIAGRSAARCRSATPPARSCVDGHVHRDPRTEARAGSAGTQRVLTARRRPAQGPVPRRRSRTNCAIPLAPISTAASLLRLSPDDPDRVRAASEIIERQVQHMTHLVNDLLDVSRVHAGPGGARTCARWTSRIAVREALEQVAPMIERKRHHVRVSLPDAPVRVLGDAARMRQVFANLLVNAAKYTPEGGHIDVRFHVENHLACIEVEDDGVGMDAALIPRVFNLFVQAESTPDRNEGGLGIGLSLVRSLVHLHGGTIKATSPAWARARDSACACRWTCRSRRSSSAV
jgi:two-component sensor histidine kinase/PAS domain-containing protein